MKTKKIGKATIHDLRDLVSVKLAVPDVSSKFAGSVPSPANDGPNIASPNIGNEPIGQATHE